MVFQDINQQKKIPNLITFARIACIPLIFICLNFDGRVASFLSGLFFTVAAVTDIFDGYYARKYGAVTALGKFLDPLADKLLISVTMIMLIPLDRIQPWIVILIIGRELAITGLRGIAVTEGVIIQASSLGKYKTIFQSVALASLCIHYTYLEVNCHIVGMFFLWIALFLTLWSGWDYLKNFKSVFQR